VLAHRRIREVPAEGGASTRAQLVHDQQGLELGKRLLDALAWHGVVMVEFKQHAADGTNYLVEVNPRFWGSLDLALAAGADFSGDLLAIGSGEALPITPPPTRSLRFCWPGMF
jgi:predicted ATP-grasp superfamily ATP-dependent carboligase